MADFIRVIYEYAAGLYLALEFVEALLVEDYSGVVCVEYWRTYWFGTQDYGYIGRAASLLRAVGWHPCNFHVVFKRGISQDFPH